MMRKQRLDPLYQGCMSTTSNLTMQKQTKSRMSEIMMRKKQGYFFLNSYISLLRIYYFNQQLTKYSSYLQFSFLCLPFYRFFQYFLPKWHSSLYQCFSFCGNAAKMQFLCSVESFQDTGVDIDAYLIIIIDKMQIQMAIPNPIEDRTQPLTQNHTETSPYKESKYRWVIVVLTGMSLLLHGLINNAIAPIQHKMTIIYDVSSSRVTLSVILNFVMFCVVNFPANKIMDKKGLRFSSIVGTLLCFLGAFCYVLINKSYNFVILGSFFIGLSQPFLINSPAKVAANWFFPKNTALATSLMVGVNLFGLGIGFLIPTLVVKQQSTDDVAKSQISHLYFGYLIYAGSCVILNAIFMRPRPRNPPSGAATAQKVSSIVETLKEVKKHRNLWKFFPAYCIGYGSFIALGSNANFIIKPYGYSDIQIAVNGVLLMVVGTVGAILFSFYIKKTRNYKLALKVTSFGAFILLLIICIWLNTSNVAAVTTILFAIMGFIVTPTVPICYDLGCQLAFPMGEAQVTGLLNGGCLLWAFLSSAFVSSVFGYGNTKSSLWIVIILLVFLLISAVLFFFVKVDLKRQAFQKKHNEQKELKTGTQKQSQRATTDANSQLQSPQAQRNQVQVPNYQHLVQQHQGPQNLYKS